MCTIKCALINPSACGVHCANVRLESAATHVSSDLSSVHHYSPIGHSWCLCPPSDLHAFLHVSVLYACYLKCKGDTVFPRSALGLCPTIHLLIKVKPCHTCGHTHKEHVATCAVIFLSPWFFFHRFSLLFDTRQWKAQCATVHTEPNLESGLFSLLIFQPGGATETPSSKKPGVLMPCRALMYTDYISIIQWVWCVCTRRPTAVYCTVVFLRSQEMIYLI